ncbi:uncharacterized protein [Typha latifolia]|uniref:uncharacterized protein n=1 Tax=Typha latifolia TaxID=4733 RepID=UPI003C2B9340
MVIPFQVKIQPMESKSTARGDPARHAGRSRLKRLFERPFPSVLRISSAERIAGGGEKEKDEGKVEVEPSTVCLDRMILSYIEESNEKPLRSRCNCFNGNYDDSSSDELDFDALSSVASSVDVLETLKGLVPCATLAERNLLADASKILEKSKSSKAKGDFRRIVADGLKSLGYDAAICKSRWEKASSFPAGEHEYVDVIVSGDRLLVELDFRSEFEVARSTKSYRAALQSLPSIYVGTADRLNQIVSVVSEAARQSLKKKGLSFPPWRKPEYMLAKWLSPHQREAVPVPPKEKISAVNFFGEFELLFDDPAVPSSAAAEERITVVVSPWKRPELQQKSKPPSKVVTGFPAVL